jgi:hypothetical protein
LGIPLLIAIQAWVRDRWRWKDRKKPKLKEERPGCNKEIEFHQAEFVSLRSEIAELVKTAAANFQYAVVGSAGVFAWMATADRIKDHTPIFGFGPALTHYGVWLPFILSSLFCSLSFALLIRINETARYLRRVEDAIGSEKLGWEKEFAGHPGTLGWIYLYGWLFLLSGNLLLAMFLPDKSSP